MKPIVYVLDASSLIQAARVYYTFDIAPGFWRSLIDNAYRGHIQSIDWVKEELKKGNDQLAKWADKDFSRAFTSTDREDVIVQYAEIMRWVYGQAQYSDDAKAKFASGADGWLVAYSKVVGGVVVTQEQASPDAKNRVPIPNVCDTFNVKSIDTFQMLRALGVRFT